MTRYLSAVSLKSARQQGGFDMAIDPLSAATRNTKRNLLIASVLAITFRAFDVTIEQIPIAGLSIKFDRGVFWFLLFSSLAYFLLTFALYYFIDIRNVEDTSHQSKTEKLFESRLKLFPFRFMERCASYLRVEKYSIRFTKAAADTINMWARKSYAPNEEECSGLIELYSETFPMALDRQIFQSHYREGGDLVKNKFVWMVRRRRGYYWQLLPWLYAVRSAYFVRNYFTDGIFPLALGFIALLGMLNLVDLRVLQKLSLYWN